MEILLGWARESNFEYDVPCGAGITIRPKKPQRVFKDNKIQYNQRVDDPYGCTWYWAMTCVINNWDITRTDNDFVWFRTKAREYGWKDKIGMYTSKAWDMVVDRLNMKYPDQNRVKESIRVYDNTDEVKKLLKNGWMLHFSSQINSVYTNDIKDWVVEKPRWADGIWHSRSFTTPSRENDWTMIVENYDWLLPHNVIDIKDFEELVKAKQFHIQVFIYYPTTKMQDIPYPYMTIEEADKLERQYPSLFTSNFSESVRAWIDASQSWTIKRKYKNYKWIDWVMKMMIDLSDIR